MLALSGSGLAGLGFGLLALGNKPEKGEDELEASADGHAATKTGASVQERLSDACTDAEHDNRQQTAVTAPRVGGRNEREKVWV